MQKSVVSLLVILGLICGGLVWRLWPRAPQIEPMHLVTQEDTKVPLVFQINSFPVDKLEFKLLQAPLFGQITGEMPHLFYQPDPDFHGKDRFAFQLIFQQFSSDQSIAEVVVEPVNDTPKPEEIQVEIPFGQSGLVELKAKDLENDEILYDLVSQPKEGRLSGEPPLLTYQPRPGFVGEDSFLYQARDPFGQSGPARVLIKVHPALQVEEQSLMLFQGKPKRLTLLPPDLASQGVSFDLLAPPKFGQVTPEPQGLWYQPQEGYAGLDYLVYRLRSGPFTSGPIGVKLQVTSLQPIRRLQLRLDELVGTGRVIIGDPRQPTLRFAKGEAEPASLVKLITAAAALDLLGEEFRSQTQVFVDRQRNLILKGWGDPYFNSRDLLEIAQRVKHSQPPGGFNALWLDASAFGEKPDYPGRQASQHHYHAPLGALALNRNQIELVPRKGRWEAKDQLTPLTPSLLALTKGLNPRIQRLSVATSSQEALRVTGELALALFAQEGVRIRQGVELATKPAGAELLFSRPSRQNLGQMVRLMLEESDNFMANQLVMIMSMQDGQAQASLSRGVDLLERYLEFRLGVSPELFELVEGSGLSRSNRVEGMALLQVLNSFHDKTELLPNLKDSLFPELSQLARRYKIRAKTGTLNDTANLAGYIYQSHTSPIPFVLMLKGDRQERARLLQAIAQALAEQG